MVRKALLSVPAPEGPTPPNIVRSRPGTGRKPILVCDSIYKGKIACRIELAFL